MIFESGLLFWATLYRMWRITYCAICDMVFLPTEKGTSTSLQLFGAVDST